MKFQQETPQKKSYAHSTVAPTTQLYRIPSNILSDDKNLKSILVNSKYLDESKSSVAQNYFFKTKLDGDHDADQKIEFRKSPKPKIQNKLHLDLPTQKKVEVHKYVGEQKHFQQTVSSFFAKIFKSCVTPQTQENFQECEYCQHRYYVDEEKQKEKQKKQFAKELSQPYISLRRLTERQTQPIQVFYQQITSQPIRNNRWESNHWEFSWT